jgi:hypothetical protein
MYVHKNVNTNYLLEKRLIYIWQKRYLYRLNELLKFKYLRGVGIIFLSMDKMFKNQNLNQCKIEGKIENEILNESGNKTGK